MARAPASPSGNEGFRRLHRRHLQPLQLHHPHASPGTSGVSAFGHPNWPRFGSPAMSSIMDVDVDAVASQGPQVSQETPKKARDAPVRRRTARLACDFCHKKKTKCDGSYPCSNCKSRSCMIFQGIEAINTNSSACRARY